MIIPFLAGLTSFLHPCFIGVITTFYALLAMVKRKKEFIIGAFIGSVIVNFSFIYFTDALSKIVSQKVFNYLLGGLLIYFGLMFMGVIKHKHNHDSLLFKNVDKFNPFLLGILTVFSWIQSFFHIFIPVAVLIKASDNLFLNLLAYNIGVIIPVLVFKKMTTFAFLRRPMLKKIGAGALIIVGIITFFDATHQIEELINFKGIVIKEEGHHHHHHGEDEHGHEAHHDEK